MPVDNSFIPRAFGVTDARQRVDELARKQQALDGANRNSSSTIPPGGTLRVEGGVLVPGGQISVTGGGNISTTADGIDRYTSQPIKVSTSLGNREVIEPWTGLPVLRPGIWLANTTYQTDPANMASLTSRYGDNVEIQSLNYEDGAGGRWRSAANIDPAGASLGWNRQDGDPTSPSTGGTSHSGGLSVSLDSALFLDAYVRSAAPDDPAVIHSYNAITMRPWGGQMGPPDGLQIRYEQSDYNGTYINKGLFKFDKDGLMTLHSEKGSNKVDITHNGDGVLNLAGSTRVNISGALTVGGTLVPLSKADIGLGNVDNTSDANKPVSTAQQAAINALKPASWVTVTAAASWEGQSTDPVQVRTSNGSAQLRGKFHYLGANTTAGNNSASSLLMGTLPSGTWPPYEVNHVAMAIWGASSVLTPCRVAIGSDGQIRLYGLGSQGVFTAFDVRTTTYVYLGDLTYPL